MDQTNYRTIPCGWTTYLKFLLVERLKEVLRNKFIKTLLQSQELCLYSSHESPIYIQPGGGGKQKVRDSELDRTGLFIAELEDAHFTEELGLVHTFSILRAFISFFSINSSIFLTLYLQGIFLFCNTWHILSCSLLSLEYSCHLVWVHAVKSAQKRCVPHKMYGPELGWYRSLWQQKERG